MRPSPSNPNQLSMAVQANRRERPVSVRCFKMGFASFLINKHSANDFESSVTEDETSAFDVATFAATPLSARKGHGETAEAKTAWPP
jgi:hypothetical protein